MRVLNFLLLLLFAAMLCLSGCGGGGTSTPGDQDLPPGNNPGGTGSGEVNEAMIDLGTVSGATLGGFRSWGTLINDAGQVVGLSSLASDEQSLHAFIIENSDDLTATDIGTLGGLSSEPFAVNELGQVVGQSDTAAGDFRAFFWKPGDISPTNIGTFGGEQSAATDVNDSGKVVGWAENGSGFTRAFIWDRQTMTMTDLGTLGGQEAKALAINNAGQVVGTSKDADGKSHAFLWQSGKGMTNLDTLEGFSTTALFINDQGEVVGQRITSSGEVHAFYYDPVAKVMTAIDPLGEGVEMEINGFNNNGEAVGASEFLLMSTTTNSYNDTRAFVWDADTKTMTDLGTLSGHVQSGANAINDQGQIVGWSEGSDGIQYAVSWDVDTSAKTELGLLYSQGGNTIAHDVNATGEIVGEGVLFAGDDLTTAWLLVP